MTGFTPGPWEACQPDEFDGAETLYGQSRVIRQNLHNASAIIGLAHWGNGPLRDECDANAHLIAAAPDLYAALAWYVENDETDTDTGFYAEGRERAKAALSKARGETP